MKNILLFALLSSLNILMISSCADSKNKDKDNMEMKSPMVVHDQDDTTHSGDKMMDDGLMNSMNMMQSTMDGMTMSGDIDLDFATMMVMHHQAAIDMSSFEIANGTDAEAKTMAQKIITAQKAEIDQFQNYINSTPNPTKKEKGHTHNELDEIMQSMMVNMKKMALSGNTDKDFVMMMIPHHESAIDMAEVELSHGQNQAMKKIAKKIITDQQKEIAEFKAWQTTH